MTSTIITDYSLTIPVMEMNEMVGLLLYKHLSGEALEKEEATVLDTWLAETPHNRALLEELQYEPWLDGEIRELLRVDENAAWTKLHNQIMTLKNKRPFSPERIIQYFFIILFTLLTIARIYASCQYVASKNKSVKAKNESVNKIRNYDILNIK